MRALMLLDLFQLVVVEDHAALRTSLVPMIARRVVVPSRRRARLLVLLTQNKNKTKMQNHHRQAR